MGKGKGGKREISWVRDQGLVQGVGEGIVVPRNIN